ncbi:MAG TPA: response regulator transcription factor [Candidatus Dormibacteraeota bacterium]|nr:response regulator transcription factor [Candidatus Dormibacteraeota bacterium]
MRLFIADDHEIVRFGLRTLLETQYGWTVIGESADGKEAVEMVLERKPDVTLLDISMPRLSGLEAARQILARGSRTKILMLSAHDSDAVIEQVLDSGARGFVLKTDAARDLIAAVDAVRSNQTFFTPRVAQVVLDRHMKRVQEYAAREENALRKSASAGGIESMVKDVEKQSRSRR